MGWFVAIFFSVRGNADGGLVVLCMAISLSAGGVLFWVFFFVKKKNFRQSERVFQTHTLVCFHFFALISFLLGVVGGLWPKRQQLV